VVRLARIATLRIDVDTWIGLSRGVPKVLRLLRELGIHATFFITMGPDSTFMNIFRRGSVGYGLKINPFRKYGVNIFAGLIWKPMVGLGNERVLSLIVKEGHEIGCHGYNHLLWASKYEKLKATDLLKDLKLALDLMEDRTGLRPLGFAPPAFKFDAKAAWTVKRLGFLYISSSRRGSPRVTGGIIQIPVNTLSIEELEVAGYNKDAILHYYSVIEGEYIGIYVHACYEGRVKVNLLEKVIKLLTGRGFKFKMMREIAYSLADRLEDTSNIRSGSY